MLSYTNTSTTQLGSSSSVSNAEEFVRGDSRSKTETLQVSDVGHLLSIELMRQKIRSELGEIFQMSESRKEFDFLAENQDLVKLLPSLGKFFMNEFGEMTTLSLELMEEEYNWKTLFINIGTENKRHGKEISGVINTFLEHMFDMFPEQMKKLNIDIFPNAV
ncbi:MAG: hypothetical protein RIE59_19355 [Imperialibacter sp.]